MCDLGIVSCRSRAAVPTLFEKYRWIAGMIVLATGAFPGNAPGYVKRIYSPDEYTNLWSAVPTLEGGFVGVLDIELQVVGDTAVVRLGPSGDLIWAIRLGAAPAIGMWGKAVAATENADFVVAAGRLQGVAN